jgi:hypothetical protein
MPFLYRNEKDFIVSKIEASQDGSPYVYVAFTDPNEPKSTAAGGGGAGRNFPQSPFGIGVGAIPFTSPEDLMKNLPKAMSNMLGGGGGISGDSPTFKISMKEYEDMQLKVGDKVTIEIKRADGIGV